MGKMRTRMGVVLLVCMMLLCVLPVTALAGDEPTTIYVNATYDDSTTPSDGTEAAPYTKLIDAVNAAKDGDTVKLLSDATGCGIVIDSSKYATKGLTIDFGGNTYTVDEAPLAGSSGTESQCFQLLTGGSVTMKNGTVKTTYTGVAMIIQNYCNLMLDSMNVDGSGMTRTGTYTMSNNCGNVVIQDSTITAKTGDVAFDVYGGFQSYGDVTVTVAGNSEINGTVEVDRGNQSANTNKLIIEGGTFNGAIDVKTFGNEKTEIDISGGTFSTDVSKYLDDDSICIGSDGTFTVADLTTENAVAVIGSTPYKTFEAAVQAATAGDTIELNANVTLTNAISLETGDNITIEGNDHTISFAAYSPKVAFTGVDTYNREGIPTGVTLKVSNVTFKNTSTENTSAGYAALLNFDAADTEVSFDKCKFENLYCAVLANPWTGTASGKAPVISITSSNFTDTTYGYSVDETTAGAVVGAVDPTFTDNGDVQECEIWTQVVYATNDENVTKAFKTIQDAVDYAKDGSEIVVAPGTYDGNVLFGGKSLTIKAQYPAYVDGAKTEDGKLSKFTGTFNTYGGASDAFYEDQTIVIDGFALSGDGMKIGNNNYNSVGNLEVRHCTMTFGQNLANANANSYAGLNYFVKVNGNAGAPYASVTVEDNYVSGEPVENVYPIQLWDVDMAVVKGNTMELENAAGHQAIGVSKMAKDATVEITKNVVNGAGGGIYVTTWLLDGVDTDAQAVYTGTITVKDNTLGCVESETMYPIFLGYEENENSVPYGLLAGTQIVNTNTDKDDKNIDAVTVRGPEKGDTTIITATFVNDKTTVAEYSTSETKLKVTAPAAPEKAGYTFLGWKYGDEIAKAGDTVTISESTEFVAQWEEILVTKITLDKTSLTLVKGDTATLTATVEPNDAANTQVGWSSSNDKVATVEGGEVTAAGCGTATITAKISEDVYASCEVSVICDDESCVYYDDLSDDNPWYHPAVDFVTEHEIMQGIGNKTFAPEGNLTRAQFAQILYNMERKPQDYETDETFPDVHEKEDGVDVWYYDAVMWAASTGIVEGYENGCYYPDKDITRQEMVTMLHRYAEYKTVLTDKISEDLEAFPDSNDDSVWDDEAFAWAVQHGIVNGKDGKLAAGDPARRCEIAKIIMVYMSLVDF